MRLRGFRSEDVSILDASSRTLLISQVARLLDVSIDVVRNWERNGLIQVPLDPCNGYRRFGPEEFSRMRVIWTLSRGGYSLSTILRMLVQLDRGEAAGLRHALDTPLPGEDVFSAFDHWIPTLDKQ